LVEKYGRFRDVRILQGFGFVEFDDNRDADDVVKDLDGRDFMGERYFKIFDISHRFNGCAAFHF
jgi:hypothetical protein